MSQEEKILIFTEDKTTTSKEHHIYFNKSIQTESGLSEINYILNNAEKNDKIYFHLNCTGGSVSQTIELVTSIKECKGKVITINKGVCASGASVLLLSGHEIIIKDMSMMMCHYYHINNSGKGNEIESRAEFEKKFLHSYFKEVYSGFLSNDELNRMFKGEDFWFDSKEVKRRLKIK